MASSIEFNGQLRNDAPGLFGNLQRTCGEADLPLFEAAYAHSFRTGGLAEGKVARKPEASFNPRPARVCHIMLTHTLERRPTYLAAALLSVSDGGTDDPGLQESQRIADAARAFLRSEASAPREGEAIALAAALDTLRHLHMSTAGDEEIAGQIEWATKWALRHSVEPGNARLRTLIEAAADRLTRIVSERRK